jgi:mannose/cellobiose epimerase-like protein (N-acyl-D-glucosamine 2-epimerase family)
MTMPSVLRDATGRLIGWLKRDALPLWATRSLDPSGGFHDRLSLDAGPVAAAKRVRVQARQAYVYATAAERGWMEGAEPVSRHGLTALLTMRGEDGLYRNAALPRADASLDGMGLIYDQAFALLALAHGHGMTGDFEPEADASRRAIAPFAQPIAGYAEAPGLAEPLFANPNMHFFESFMAWRDVSPDPVWAELAARQAWLALDRLTQGTGLVLEQYDADWRVPAAPLVWPGHLYEWAFLLLRHDPEDSRHRSAALWLIQQAEAKGVDHGCGVAIFALDGRLDPIDRGARLWAQTERLRAVATAASLTGDAGLWDAALEACGALEVFLDTPTPGLWRDWMDEAGVFREEPAPATSFYHIVGAIAELERLAGEGA